MAKSSRAARGLSRLLAVAVAVSTLTAGLALPGPAARAATTTTFAQDTTLYMSGPGITLTIDSGSEVDSLSVTSTTFTVVVSAGSAFTVRYPGPNPGNLANNGGLATCSYLAGDNVIEAVGPVTATFTPAAAPVCNTVPGGSGGGGGGGGTPPAFAYLLSGPIGGSSYNAGDSVSLSWNAGGAGVSNAKLSLSTNDGSTWTTISADRPTSGSMSWAVPNVTTSQARLKVEGINTSGSVLASTVSSFTFSIVGSMSETGDELVIPPVDETPSVPTPDSDPNVIGGFSAQSALNATRSINSDLGLQTADESVDVYCVSGSLIKTEGSSAVYYCGADGKRYTFPHERIFYTWFDNFDGVITILPETMARIPLGGNVMYRPGRRMIKIESDPKVYAVTRGGVLRWVTTERVAEAIYGPNWNRMIDDVSVAFFFSYTIGEPINESDVGL
ncbi:MAG: hypothetical protein ABIJ46_02060 [bacterium]